LLDRGESAAAKGTQNLAGVTQKIAKKIHEHRALIQKKTGKAAGGDDDSDSDEELGADSNYLQRIINSKQYEAFSGILIMTNAIFIGWQAQFLAEWQRDSAFDWAAGLEARNITWSTHNTKNLPGNAFGMPPIFWLVGNAIYAVLFTVELLPRWKGEGFIDFFKTHEITWNVLDVVVVTVGIVESVMDMVERATDERSGGVLQNISVMRMLRILRIVRVVRVIRVMKFFRELRMMVYSIIGSMKNLMWVMLILMVTFYLFGITFTSAVTSSLVVPSDYHQPRNIGVLDAFGTVDRSILSLFMSMSGGNDWIVYYETLKDLTFTYRLFFLLFIIFTLFAIVNIVTGVFVESALQSNMKDRDIMAHEELQSKKRYLESMQDIFEEMDADGQGTISMEEFQENLKDERVIAYFNALKLDVTDARVLFRLLDTDDSGEITIDEFIVGCYKLQGESRSLDMKIMQFELNVVRDLSHEMHHTLSVVRGHLMPESADNRGTSIRKTTRASAGNDDKQQSWQEVLGLNSKDDKRAKSRHTRISPRPATP